MQRRVEKLVHISIWLMLLALLYSSSGRITRISQNELGEAIVSVSYQPLTLVILITDLFFKALLFYGNVYYLSPRFKLHRQKKQYPFWIGVLFIGTLGLGLLVNYVTISKIGGEMLKDLTLDYMSPYSLVFHTFILLLSLGYISILDRKKNALMEEQLREEKLVAELKYLKSQVNPHFLFNTLNNIYALVRKHEDPRASESIARLARLMRYMIYESNVDTVSLQKELDYLKDFIDLQKVRMHAHNVDMRIELDGGVNRQIAPMLLIPFIENAFKHADESGHILIDISFLDQELTLMVENELNERSQLPTHRGVGLENVIKRLALLYPEKHELNIDESEKYKVILKLILN